MSSSASLPVDSTTPREPSISWPKKQESGQRGQEAELSNLAEAIFQLGRLKEVLDSSLPTARSTSDVNQDKDGTTLEQKPYGVLITSLLLRALAGILERLLELFDMLLGVMLLVLLGVRPI